MKTCPVCLDSVEVNTTSCPSCGEKLSVPEPQRVVTAVSPAASVQGVKPKGGRSSARRAPLVRLYALVILALGGLILGLTVILGNNETRSETFTPAPTAKPNEDKSDRTPTGWIKASSIENQLIKAGVCEYIDYYGGWNNEEMFYEDDLFRACYIGSESGLGDKYVSIYTGPILSARYADVANLKTFEAAIIGDGWTVVINYYPSQNGTFLDDQDIKAITGVLGGRTVVKD